MSVRSTDEKDFILRILKQISEAMARMREMVTGDVSSGVRATVLAEAQSNITTLLGNDASLLESLDASTAAQLVGDHERVTMWADLLELQADACEQDDAAKAQRLKSRAAALRSAASRASANP